MADSAVNAPEPTALTAAALPAGSDPNGHCLAFFRPRARRSRATSGRLEYLALEHYRVHQECAQSIAYHYWPLLANLTILAKLAIPWHSRSASRRRVIKVNILEAKSQLSQLIKSAQAGEQPLARLCAAQRRRDRRDHCGRAQRMGLIYLDS
jgi:hypothetical protein